MTLQGGTTSDTPIVIAKDDELIEIMSRTESVETGARVLQGEAAFLFANKYDNARGALYEAAKETGIRYKTLWERYTIIDFYGPAPEHETIELDNSMARYYVDWGEGMISWTDLRAVYRSVDHHEPLGIQRRRAHDMLVGKVTLALTGEQLDREIRLSRRRQLLMTHTDERRGIEVRIYKITSADPASVKEST